MMEPDELKEEKATQNIRLMTLSSSFSKKQYIFYSTLRFAKSVIVTASTLWYSYYFLIRTDDEKAYSYFENKSRSQHNKKLDYLYRSKTRASLEQITIGSLIFCAITNILSKLKKRSLTKLLLTIKSSHSTKPNQQNKKKIYLKQSDLKLLDQWKVLLGGHKFYVGSLDTVTMIMLYVSLTSETTMFDALHHHYVKYKTQQKDRNQTDGGWKNRYFQFADEKQEIEWLNNEQREHVESSDASAPDIYTNILLSHRILMGLTIGLPTFILSYSCFPISALCALHVFKCGLNTKHRQECDNWMYCNQWISYIAFAGCIFQGIINKLHFVRYFAIREVSLTKYKKMEMKKKKKLMEKGKLERRVRNLLSLRSFSYDAVSLLPWICLYFSCVCGKASTFYIKTFASSSLYSAFKGKHQKNKYILRILSVSTLMMGILIGLGNETYFGSVKYAKRWFMDFDEFSIESYKAKNNSNDNDNAAITPGNDNDDEQDMKRTQCLNTTDEESDQIEGGQNKTKHNALYQRIINGNYQKEIEMLLSNRYFHQKAHDIFECVTEICVFLEDKFLNSFIIPAF